MLLFVHSVWRLNAAAGTGDGPAGQRGPQPGELRVRRRDPDQGPAGGLPAEAGAQRTGAGRRSHPNAASEAGVSTGLHLESPSNDGDRAAKRVRWP